MLTLAEFTLALSGASYHMTYAKLDTLQLDSNVGHATTTAAAIPVMPLLSNAQE